MNESLVNKILFSVILVLFLAAAWVIWNPNLPVILGLDLQGGTYLVLQAKPTPEVKNITRDVLDGIINVIDNRINGLGLAETVTRVKGKDKIEIEIPGAGVTENARILDIINSTALLEFKEAEWAGGDLARLSEQDRQALLGEDGYLAMVPQYNNRRELIRDEQIILRKTLLTGKDLKDAVMRPDEFGRMYVGLTFNPEGAEKFRLATLRSVGKPLAILLDGQVISAPTVQEPISGGQASITGTFTAQEVRDLVIKLNAGALPVPIEIVENKIIGPSLGADAIAKSITAAWIALGLVILAMLLVYRFNGLLANLALVIYAVLVFAVLIILRAVLTLPGIAGLILSVGMAVDANVIIFERLKEEIKAGGQTVLQAADSAFNKSLSAILDGNITTLLATVFLYWQGTSSIKGFAVTLFIGTVLSMFSALVVSRLLMKNAYQLKFLRPKSAEGK